MAEGIAGLPYQSNIADVGIARSLLEELSEDGRQTLKVTKVHKKNTELLFPEEDDCTKYLDDYVTPPAPSNTTVMWLSRFLSEKDGEE